MKTKVYDLCPQASELWAVAGPEGYQISDIDPENLPDGFRWVSENEWQELQDEGRRLQVKAKKLTVPQVAERLGVVQSRIRAMIKQGKFPSAEKIMRDWVIDEKDLDLPQVRDRKPGKPRKTD